MKTVRLIADILHQLTRVVSLLYFIVAAYALATVCLHVSGLPSSMETHDGAFVIFFPFTHTAFLLGDDQASYMVMMIAFLSFYALFFWLLSRVFHAFKQVKLFTRLSVRKLSRFYIANLILPPAALILAIIFYNEITGDIFIICILHLIIAVFAFFMSAIFKQGLVLQEEQDLTF